MTRSSTTSSSRTQCLVFLVLLAPWICGTLAADPKSVNSTAGTAPAASTLSQAALELPLIDVTRNDAVVALGDLRRDGGLLVVFLSNSCPYVLDWADRLAQLEAQAGTTDLGLALINSNARKRKASDSPDEMRRFADQFLGDLPYLLDEQSRLADLLDAQRTPETFLFDADLRLVYRGLIDDHSGPIEEVKHHWLRDSINALGAGVAGPESQPALGCAVQRPRRRASAPKSSPTSPGGGGSPLDSTR